MIVFCGAGLFFVLGGFAILGLMGALWGRFGWWEAVSMLPKGLLAATVLVAPPFAFFLAVLLFSRRKLRRWENAQPSGRAPAEPPKHAGTKIGVASKAAYHFYGKAE